MPLTKLTWTDLLIEAADPNELSDCLAPWGFVVTGQVAPIFLNRFGSWFLRRPDGSVDVLDVLEGTVNPLAPSYDVFATCVNNVQWQEDYLLSRQVFALHDAGLIATGTQCYAVPHPRQGFPDPRAPGGLNPQFVRLTSLKVWQSICRQALGGPP